VYQHVLRENKPKPNETENKQWFFSPGRKPRRMRGGIGRGMIMELDLSHQSQYYWGLYEREIFPVLRRLNSIL